MFKMSFIKSVVLVIATSIGIASCDKVDAPFVIPGKPVDTSACPAPVFPSVTSHFKRVLLEDYTGHNCPNCPQAGQTAQNLKTQYKDSLVVMAVHAGFFAKPSTSNPVWAYDFRTPAGTEWDSYFSISAVGNPNGLINRKGYTQNKQVITPSAWADAIKQSIAENPMMDLQLITEYDAAVDKLCIHTKTTFLKPVSGRSLNISIVITEDNIIQAQKNSIASVGLVPEILDYTHMHVLRGAVNGLWGTPVLLKENSASGSLVKTFRTSLVGFNANVMVIKNCHVIAFLYDVDTKEVLQVAEKAMID